MSSMDDATVEALAAYYHHRVESVSNSNCCTGTVIGVVVVLNAHRCDALVHMADNRFLWLFVVPVKALLGSTEDLFFMQLYIVYVHRCHALPIHIQVRCSCGMSRFKCEGSTWNSLFQVQRL